MITMKKPILVTVLCLALTSFGDVIWAQPTTPTGETDIKMEVTPAPAPTTPPPVNFDNLSESVTKNVQKRLDESRRDAVSKQHSRKQMVRGAVYGIVAIVFVAIAFFNKRKSARRKK